MPLFAQVKIGDINQSLSYEIIAIVLFAFMALNLILQVIDRFKSKPPINEKLHAYQTKQECTAFCNKFNTQLNELSQRTDIRLSAQAKAAAESRSKLYDKMNENTQKVAGIEADIKNLVRINANLEQRLNQLLLRDKK